MAQRKPTPMHDIICECLSSFNLMTDQGDKALRTKKIMARLNVREFEFRQLQTQLLDWAYDTEAFPLRKTSLEDKLRGFEALSAMVMEQLQIILHNLRRVDCKLEGFTFYGDFDGVYAPDAFLTRQHEEFLEKWHDAALAVYDALDKLRAVVFVIREYSAEQVEASLTTRLTDADKTFRREIMSVVRQRLPAARKVLCRVLADSIVARRLLLLHKKQHSRRSAVERAQEAVPLVPPSMSRVGPEVLAALAVDNKPKDDSSGYSPSTKANPGETQVQCPSCLVAPERKAPEQVDEENWKLHFEEDIKPYGCLYPRCSQSLVFFAHRHEWESHMESKHSSDWMRTVHTMTWFCDVDHNDTLAFDTYLQWREHVLDPASHPSWEEPPNNHMIDLPPWRQNRYAPREQFACPLCERIPDEIKQGIEDRRDSPQIYHLLLAHVAYHIRSLSLLAVPSPDTSALLIETEKESAVQPLSSRDLIVHPLLPQELWPSRDANGMVLHKDWSRTDDILERLRFCHGLGPKLTEPDQGGRNLLSRFVHSQQEQWVRQSLETGASANLVDEDGQTLLLRAAYGGSDGIVQILVDHSAVINIADQTYGRTALSWASFKGYEKIVGILLEAGGNPDAVDYSHRTPLSLAAAAGNESIVRLLMAASPDYESRDSTFGRTLLAWAVSKDQAAVAKLLIDQGANVDALDKSHRTPLSWAAEEGKTAMVELLIAGGADIESPHPGTSQTPLALACERGSAGVVEVLLKAGANVEAKDSQGWTPLDWALDKGHDDVAKLLNSIGDSAKK